MPNFYKQLHHLGIYSTLLYVVLVGAVAILIFLMMNAWQFGIKQERFKNSKTLKAFYILSMFYSLSVIVKCVAFNIMEFKIQNALDTVVGGAENWLDQPKPL
jgi:NADH:ubiquinone oxidoreductase subunit 6 (subunit J)